jgi:hypothetical protein
VIVASHPQAMGTFRTLALNTRPVHASRIGVACTITAAGGQASAIVCNPMLGLILVSLEVGVGLAMIGTALFGSEQLSARAIRLLCLFLMRPPAPYLAPKRPIGRKARDTRDC